REVAALAPEQRVGRDAHDDVQVAGRPAVAPRAAAALEPDALAVLHARGDADLHLPRPALDAAAPARLARLLDDRPPAAALRTGLAEREQALVVVERAPAAAARAGDRARA